MLEVIAVPLLPQAFHHIDVTAACGFPVFGQLVDSPPDFAQRMAAQVHFVLVKDMDLPAGNHILDRTVGAALGNGILAGFIGQIRHGIDLVINEIAARLVVYRRQQRRQCLLFNGFKDHGGDMECCLVDALILTLEPSGQRPPHIVNTADVPGTEETLLHEAYRVLYRAFALRIALPADVKPQFLLSAEIVEYPGLDHLTVCLAGDEYGVLVDH